MPFLKENRAWLLHDSVWRIIVTFCMEFMAYDICAGTVLVVRCASEGLVRKHVVKKLKSAGDAPGILNLLKPGGNFTYYQV
jgi:hypothetical protein